MTRRQKITIAAILLAPVVLGLVLLSFEDRRSRAALIPGTQSKRIGFVRILDVVYFADNYVWQLRELRKDKSVAGVLLRIDSPGGGVVPSQEIYDEVMRYRTEDKPLVVSMGNIAASGAYYFASPARKIFANPGTITGSIGVVFRFPQYYDLLKKVGVKFEVIKAGTYKNLGTPHREMSDKERALLQELLDDTHDQFISDVCEAREMDIDTLRRFADGRIFTGRQAHAFGLIDTLGSYDDALAYLREHVGLSERAKIIEKKRRRSVWRDIFVEEMLDRLPFFAAARKPGGAYFLLENY
jgi:protease-4